MSIATMLVGAILAAPVSHVALMFWVGSLIGVVLFCCSVGIYWVITVWYSPTKYDANTYSTTFQFGPDDY